ncbi:MAG: hypothetical protein H7Y15_16010 [Pseudonocardia sp.]|nr:hypothetical protein [Pseudonocardia sp.]
MTQETLALRLSGTDVPPGEIALGALASIAEALQSVARRVGRDLVGQSGPGRPSAGVDRLTRMVLSGVSQGSTRLEVRLGAAGTLPVDDPVEAEVGDRIWELFGSFAANRRPEWTTPSVDTAATALVNALATCARRCEFSGERAGVARPVVSVVPALVDLSVWTVARPPAERRSEVSVSGVLDLVDLRARRFRVQDDVGNDIVLEDVENAAEAGTLLGRRVTAVGAAETGRRGQVIRLVEPRVTSAELPREWFVRPDLDLTTALSVGPDYSGIDGVDDDEVEAFLASLRS